MEIKSTEVTINASAEEVYNFLTDAQNIYHLLPQDKITNWEADEKSCSFKVQQAATISLIQDEVKPTSSIKMISGEKAPFPFTLTILINADGGGKCSGYLLFEGKINTFLKMMVEKPLTNLFNFMSGKLQDQFEG